MKNVPIQNLGSLYFFIFLMLTSTILTTCMNEENIIPDKNALKDGIDALIEKMTLEEKVKLIHASSPFTSGGIARLGIPELVMSDGPHGVRHEHGRDWIKDKNVEDRSTYLPVGTGLAATWNRELGYAFGQVLGREANFRGKDVILGPGLNIIRDPLNGRNFEYLSEDPHLNSVFVRGYIEGVQEQGVAACAKHYIANTLEYERTRVNVVMSERALREIYLPGYKACVDAGVWTFMAAYNKFRGTYCAHNKYLLDDILRDEWGFEGVVISDWNAVKSAKGAIPVGLDIEMGTELSMPPHKRDFNKFHMADTAVALVQDGVFEEALIDKKVRRILWVMDKVGKFSGRPEGAYNTPEHQAVARAIAEESIVLLKNEDLLPLKKDNIRKIAVIGANADRKHAGGGGSSQVKAYYEITPLEGLKDLLGENVRIEYSPGYTISRNGGTTDTMIKEAVTNASNADVVIYVGGFIHGYTDEWNDNAYDAEAWDKPDMFLPFDQDKLIQSVLEANPNTAIVLYGGGPVDMRSWKDNAKAIIQAFYPGMEGGNALAEVLFGIVNPSGKLPMTFPEKLEDSPAHSVATYPDDNLLIDHKEGIYVGYRYFDTYGVEPGFPFGHGLSYTTFEYANLKLVRQDPKVVASLTLRNAGNLAGKEVVQLYVHDVASTLERPDKELKGFEKVYLDAGESKIVEISLDNEAFRYYDPEVSEWVLEPGEFIIKVGPSSRDIRLEKNITM